jgi:hypothetical protein
MATENGTALVQRTENSTPALSAFEGNGAAFDTVARMAKGLATSTLIPEAYRNNPQNVMVALEYAHRLGASVLAVMQNLDVIHGRPSLRASFLIGTVNACGRFSPIRFRWLGERGTDGWGCYAVAKDRESGEECIGPEVTIKTAKDEGWYGKAGSKWKTIPQLMLMYRAGAWWSRVYCPELSLGLSTTDETEDMAPSAVTRVRGIAQALDAGDDAPPTEGVDPEPTEDELRATLELVIEQHHPGLLNDAEALSGVLLDIVGHGDWNALDASDMRTIIERVQA